MDEGLFARRARDGVEEGNVGVEPDGSYRCWLALRDIVAGERRWCLTTATSSSSGGRARRRTRRRGGLLIDHDHSSVAPVQGDGEEAGDGVEYDVAQN